jgi:surface protein
MFCNCSLLKDENISYWDTSHVTNMSQMFEGCSAFNQPVNNWDVSKVTNMSYMFYSNTYPMIFNQSVNNWDVSKVNEMSYMFFGCTDFNNGAAPGITGTLFADLKAPTSALTITWNTFNNCTSFNQSVNNWDMSNVGYMRAMFNGCSLFNQPLEWTLFQDIQPTNGMKILLFGSGLSQGNVNKTLVHWATQYKYHPSTFPRNIELFVPHSPTDDGITQGYDKLYASSPDGPGWQITWPST